MNSFYNFLLVSRKTADAELIKQEIERNRLYRVHTVETAQAALDNLPNTEINCYVFNFGTFSIDKISLVTDLRDLGYNFAIVIFASFVQKEAYDTVKKIERVVLIEKPFESKDVWGICQKIFQGRKVNQRIFRRFYTNQTAQFEKSGSGEMIDGQIFNLSRGGAYVELKSGDVKPGEMVKVSVKLDEVAKSYNVDAQVVWYSPKTSNGMAAAGVRFMKSGDVYRNLLTKL